MAQTRMETMAVSKFKATCLAVLQRVSKTGRPVRITRFGKPVADVVPPRPGTGPCRAQGADSPAAGEGRHLVTADDTLIAAKACPILADR